MTNQEVNEKCAEILGFKKLLIVPVIAGVKTYCWEDENGNCFKFLKFTTDPADNKLCREWLVERLKDKLSIHTYYHKKDTIYYSVTNMKSFCNHSAETLELAICEAMIKESVVK